MRVLIIEDEIKLQELIKTRLLKENYVVDVAGDGEIGEYLALSNSYDLIILDIMLPIVDGFTILKEINDNKIDSKVLILSAKSELNDKLKGLKGGASDYLTKPFEMEELVARCNILVNNDDNNILEFNDIKLDIKNSCLININTSEEIDVLYKELLILELFIRNSNLILNKDQIYNKIWGIDREIESNNLEAYLSFIRKKLKLIDSNTTIKSIRNIGYKIVSKN